MCLDNEMILGLILIYIIAPLLFVSGLIFALVKFVQHRNQKLK